MARDNRINIILGLIDRVSGPARNITDRFRRFQQDSRIVALRNQFGQVRDRFGAVRSEAGALIRRFTIMSAVIGAVTAGVLRLVGGTARLGDDLAKTGRRIGVSVDSLQAIRFAMAQLGGVTNELTDSSLERFVRRVGQAAGGTGEAKDFLRAFNIELRDTNGNMRSTEDIFMDAVEVISKLPDEATQARAAFALFGREGQALVTAIQSGSDAIREQMDLSRRLGHITEEQARQSEEYTDRMNEMRAGLTAIKHAVMLDLMPGLTAWFERLRDLTIANREVITTNIIGRVRSFIDSVRTVASVINDVVQRTIGWTWVIRILVGLLTFKLVAAIVKSIWSVVSLGVAFAKAVPAIWAFNAALLANPIGIAIAGVAALIGIFALMRSDWVRSSTAWIKFIDVIEDTVNSVRSLFGGLRDWIVGTVIAIPDAIADAFAGVVNLVKGRVAQISGIVPDWLKSLVGGAWDIGGAVGERIREAVGLGGSTAERGGQPQSIVAQRGESQDVSGLIHIKVDSEGRARASEIRSGNRGVDFDVDTGPVMVMP